MEDEKIRVDIEPMLSVYNQVNRFAQENGMTLEVPEPGIAYYRMKVLDKHLSAPMSCHGGALAGLMDAVIGTAALSEAFAQQKLVATVEFKMNYIRPVRMGEELLAVGRIDHIGNKLIVASGWIWIGEEGSNLAAKGLGTFNLYPVERALFGEAFNT